MKNFVAGTPILRSISSAVEECHITMVIVTKEALSRDWLKFEFMAGLEKSQQEKQLCVVLVLVDVDVTRVQRQWHGHITDDMVVKVTSTDDWKHQFSTSMIERIKNMKHMGPIQIALNLSVGQVWSHFFGYSKNVMPVLKEKIRNSKWYPGNESRFPLKEFNLIPKSATAINSLSDIHDSIVREGEVNIVAQRGSFKNRPYKPPVYSITDSNGQSHGNILWQVLFVHLDGEYHALEVGLGPLKKLLFFSLSLNISQGRQPKYYFIAHIPNTLSILSESQLEQQKKTGKHLQISPGERALQVARFTIMFNHLLNHPLNPECNDMVQLIEYDDEKLPGVEIAQLLLDTVKRACSETSETDTAQNDTVKRASPEISETDSAQIVKDVQILSLQTDADNQTEEYANTVYIVHVDDNTEDAQTAEELESFLETRDIRVLSLPDSPSRTIFSNIQDAATRAKWFIFILSKAALTEVPKQQCRMVLHQSVIQDEVRLIPLLNDDVHENDLPGDLKAVLYLNKSSPDYKETIAGIIKCRSIKMEAKVSVKGVHIGMAWAYNINYLELLKVNLTERGTEKLSKKYKNAQIHHKVFLLIPKSCKTKQLGELEKDTGGQSQHPARFKQLPKEDNVERSIISNGIQRDYPLLPYMVIGDNQEEHIVFAEYVNPIKCLQEMMDTDMRALSGMTTEVFDEEVKQFQALLKDIITWQGLQQQFDVLFYDDESQGLVDVLLNQLEASS